MLHQNCFIKIIFIFLMIACSKSFCSSGKYFEYAFPVSYCHDCPSGFRCPGDDDKHQCNAGLYSSSGQSSCSTCGAGTYSSAGASQCTTCDDGKTSSVGASTCTLCPNGKSNDLNHQNCLDCTAGYYGSSGLCYQCPPGNYQNNPGQTSCILCAPGSNSSSNGNALCSQCNQDYYAPSLGTINCTPCSFGMFSNVGASSCNSVCGDGKKVSDEECDDSNLTNGDGCDSLCKIEPGYYCKETPSTSPSFCYTICGDSKRAGTEKCDDGNLNNLDGCSSSCTVEAFYECLGGTPTTVDVCRDICGDGVVVKRTINSCDDGNLQNGDGCSKLCIVESGWDCSGGSTISPDSCLTICGDGLRKGSEKCDDGNLQDNDGCSSRCIIESGFECNSHNFENKDTCTKANEATSQEAAVSTLTQVVVGISATISFSTSLLNMSSPIGIFSMINQFQLLLLLLVCGVYISDGLFNLIIGMKFSLINFEFIHIEEIYIFNNIYSYLSFDQPNENLKNIGIESGSTIINLFKLLFTILIIALIHLVFLLFFHCCRKLERSSKCYRIGYKLFTIFTFSIYIRIILQSFLTILLSSFNETYQHNANHRIEFVSFLVNILILFLMLVFFGLCILQIKKAHPTLDTSKQYYLIEFFNGLKNKTSSRMFPLIYMSQRILSCFIIIFLVNMNLIIKMSMFTFVQASTLLFLLVIRPYELARDLLSELVGQIVMTFFSCMMIYYNYKNQWNDTLNWTFIGTFMISSLISTLIAIIDLIILIKNKIKSACCLNTTRVKNYTTRNNVISVVNEERKIQEQIGNEDFEEQKENLANKNIKSGNMLRKIQKSTHNESIESNMDNMDSVININRFKI